MRCNKHRRISEKTRFKKLHVKTVVITSHHKELIEKHEMFLTARQLKEVLNILNMLWKLTTFSHFDHAEWHA